jgi:N-acetylneuraminate lyase
MDSTYKVKDIIVALVTPFQEDGKINEDVFKQLIEYNIKQGATGFFVGGSSGEGLLLSYEERVQLFNICIKYSQSKLMIANTSSLQTDEAIVLAKEAKIAGYDYISSTAPYYYMHSMKEVAHYFIELMEQSNMPLIIYNFPKLSKCTFDLENKHIIRLLNHPMIYGVKHTNYDLYELEKFTRVNKNLRIFNGYDEIYLNSLSLNVDGAIGSTFNFLSSHFVKISQCYQSGQYEEALKIQQEMNTIMDVLVEVGLIPGIKHALSLFGFECGKPRKPFMELKSSEKTKVENVLKHYIKECAS